MKQKKDIRLRPEKIQFTGSYIKILDFHSGKYKILYKEIVLAYLSLHDKELGICHEPEIVEITSDMDGELILYGSDHCRFMIKTDLAGKTAGAALLELALRAPYILIGRQDWLDVEDEMDFVKAGNMVNLMRQC